jgi:biopolymer transport protein ExbD
MAFYQRRNGRSGFEPNIQMNITALVDVTLVTLIIYILISPALEHGIDVQLPEATPSRMISSEPAVVSMSKKGRLFFNNILVSREQLRDRLSAVAGTDPETSVLIRADAGIPYGDIIQLLDQIRGVGLVNIGLVTRNKGD